MLSLGPNHHQDNTVRRKANTVNISSKVELHLGKHEGYNLSIRLNDFLQAEELQNLFKRLEKAGFEVGITEVANGRQMLCVRHPARDPELRLCTPADLEYASERAAA